MVLLAPLSVAALVVASWLAGGWRNAVLDGPDAARARLAEDEPDFVAARVLLAADGRAALLAPAAEAAAVAVVMSLGDKLVTRRLGPGDVRAVRVDGTKAGRRLRIVTTDPTCPCIELRLGGDTDAVQSDADLMTLLHGLVRDPAAPGARVVVPPGQEE